MRNQRANERENRRKQLGEKGRRRDEKCCS
jgi:hypothetical protein